ncbi:uncharacterized protein [Ptychodera flava]|uniref:uncharacterized protein n=1 Tax=Ptychodera flava TaxID=63121 RepID=UPI00396A11E3
MNGKKIICIFIPNLDIKFIDFHNFLPVPLAQLPGMFELDDLHKGYTYFPHSFNTAANQEYVGPLPDARYFGQDGMKQHERERFLRWYEDAKLKNRPFHLKKELENCCRSDVDILRRSCVKFQDMFVQMSGIDPFKVCMTISSACKVALHKNSLMEETKGVIADQRYLHRQDSSVLTLQWLEWMTFKKKASIKHVHNSGKTKIDQYWVDGYDEENNTVYELHGCYDNGCPQCYKDPGTVNTRVEKTMADLNQSAKDKMRFLRSHGFRVIEMWECDFKKEMEENHELQEFVTSLDFQVPLKPKDACYGSRTNATTLYYECEKDEEIHHVGFRNLHCHIMKFCKYPIKHPNILTQNIVSQVPTYFGLTKCRVLPPRQLYFPVLPLRVDKKLMFPCAEVVLTPNSSHHANTVTRNGPSWEHGQHLN